MAIDWNKARQAAKQSNKEYQQRLQAYAKQEAAKTAYKPAETRAARVQDSQTAKQHEAARKAYGQRLTREAPGSAASSGRSNIAKTVVSSWETDGQRKLRELARRVTQEHDDAENTRGFGDRAKRALSVAGKNVIGAVGGLNASVASTADFLLPDFVTPQPVQKVLDYYKESGSQFKEAARQENRRVGGQVGEVIGDLSMSALETLPQTALALMTGGSSTTAQAANALANAGRTLTGTQMLTNLIKNPSFGMSAARMIGPEYDQAKADGADALQATLYALAAGMVNAGIEIGSGVETIGQTAPGLRNWARAAGEEGLEEVKQGIVSALGQKGIYAPDTPWVSLSDDRAVVNPARAAQEFAGGAIVGGLLGAPANLVAAHSARNYDYLSGQDGGRTPDFDAQWNRYNQAGQLGIPIEQVQPYPTATPVGQDVAYGAHAAGMNDYAASAQDAAQRVLAGETVADGALDKALSHAESRAKLEDAVGQALPEDYAEARQAVRDWQSTQKSAVETSETEQPVRKPGLNRENMPNSVDAQTADAIDRIGRRTGVEVRFDSDIRSAGTYQDGVITIRPDAENPVRQVFVHELTHHLEQSGDYQVFSDHVTGYMSEKGTLEDARAYVRKRYAAQGVTLDDTGVDRELVAEFCDTTLFTDSDAIARLAQTKRGIAQRIRDWLHDMAVRLRGTAEEKFILEAEKRYRRALASVDGQKKSAPGETQYMFSRTQDTSAVKQAEQMEQDGKNRDEIWRETGLIRDAKGNWVQEIDDSTAKFDREGNLRIRQESWYKRLSELEDILFDPEQTGQMSGAQMESIESEYNTLVEEHEAEVYDERYLLTDFLHHDALYERYPRLKQTGLQFINGLPEGTKGYYSRRDGTIYLSDHLFGQDQKTLLHEIQHIVQHEDRRPGGASPAYWQAAEPDSDSNALYRNTAGEIEARQTAQRSDMTYDERRLETPDFGWDRAVFAENSEQDMEIDPNYQRKHPSGTGSSNSPFGSGAQNARMSPDASISDSSKNSNPDAQSVTKETQNDGVQNMLDRDADEPTLRDVMRRSARQQEVIEYLRGQLRTSKMAVTDPKGVARMANELLKEYSSRYAKSDLTSELQAVYDLLANTHGNDSDFPKIQKLARLTAEHLLAQSSVLQDETAADYTALRDYLMDTKLTLSESDRADVPGGYNEFRRAHFGSVRMGADGVPVDTAYQELMERFGEGLFPADITHPADQLLQITDVMDSLKPTYENPYSANMDEAAGYLADEILERFYEIPQAKPTFADRQAEKLTREKIKHGNQMRSLREQKNTRIAEIRAENRQRMTDAMERERERREKQVAALKNRYAAANETRRDRTTRSELRRKIERHASQLSAKLTRPSDNKHIPEEFRGAVASLLDAINLESAYSIDPQTGKRVRGVSGDPTKRTAAFQALRSIYDGILKENSGSTMLVDPDLQSNLDEVTALRNKRLSDCSADELETVWRVVRAVEASVQNADRMLGRARWATISETGSRFVAENGSRKPFAEHYGMHGAAGNLLNMHMLAPADFFHEFGEVGDALWKELRAALDTKILHTKDTSDFAHGLIGKTKIRDWSGKKAKATAFTLESGGTIRLTPAQVMSLYKLTQREQARDHILKGGIRQAPVMQGGKLVKSYEPAHVTQADLARMIGTLTDEQKRIADGLGTYMSTTLSAWGNETSMQMYGYKKFNEKNYFPIKTDENYTRTEFAKGQDARVKNMGFTKATVAHANNAIMIEDIFDVFTRHADEMGTYHAFAAALEDVERVYNYKDRDEDGNVRGSVAQSIERTTGARGKKYFRNLMTNLNEGIRSDVGGEIPTKLLGNYKAAAVGANLRVVLQQPTAILRASAMIDPQYLLIGMAKRGDFEKVKKYAPIAVWKEWGYFQLDTGRAMKDIMLGTDGLADRVKEAAMAPAGWADNITWSHLWNAVEAETKAKTDLKPGTEAFYEKVAERFSDVVDQTQVVDSVLHRSQIMRSGDGLVRLATSFMAEPTKTYNLFRTAARDALTTPGLEPKANLMRATLAIVLSGTATALAASVADAMRDDDDSDDGGSFAAKYRAAFTGLTGDETTIGEAVRNVSSGNLFDNLNPLNMIPYAKDFMSMLQGYDVKRMDMSALSDTLAAAKRFHQALNGEGKLTAGYALTNLVTMAARLTGIPAYNLKRDLEAYANGAFMALEAAGVPVNRARIIFQQRKTPVNDENKNTWIDMGYRFEQGGDGENAGVIYDMLTRAGIPDEKIEDRRKYLTTSSDDYAEKTAVETKRIMTGIVRSPSYRALDQSYQEKAQEYAAEYAVRIAQEAAGFEIPEKSWVLRAREAQTHGIDTPEYILWELAKKAAGADGSLTQDEIIDILRGMELTNRERSYLFCTKYQSKKNNPFA